jgi:hypothetical protein
MWTHRTDRLVARPLAVVRADIDELVLSTWGRVTTVSTTEHHGTRSDWMATRPGSDDIDIVLSWTLLDLDEATFVTLTLDEFEPGPDPAAGLEEVLDLLADPTRAAFS